MKVIYDLWCDPRRSEDQDVPWNHSLHLSYQISQQTHPRFVGLPLPRCTSKSGILDLTCGFVKIERSWEKSSEWDTFRSSWADDEWAA